MGWGRRSRELRDLMEFGQVVRVRDDGTVEAVPDVRAPEVETETTDDGSILKEHEADMIRAVRRQGWSLLSGWTGQYGYSGVGLHSSEYIGGNLEDHIRETPGLWVACRITLADGDGDADSWVVAHREEELPLAPKEHGFISQRDRARTAR
jgi:hypothetical protein